MNVILQDRFRANVEMLLREKGISKSELARRLGVKNPTVFLYLRPRSKENSRTPGLDVVERFAAALELDDPSDLLLEHLPESLSS